MKREHEIVFTIHLCYAYILFFPCGTFNRHADCSVCAKDLFMKTSTGSQCLILIISSSIESIGDICTESFNRRPPSLTPTRWHNTLWLQRLKKPLGLTANSQRSLFMYKYSSKYSVFYTVFFGSKM